MPTAQQRRAARQALSPGPLSRGVAGRTCLWAMFLPEAQFTQKVICIMSNTHSPCCRSLGRGGAWRRIMPEHRERRIPRAYLGPDFGESRAGGPDDPANGRQRRGRCDGRHKRARYYSPVRPGVGGGCLPPQRGSYRGNAPGLNDAASAMMVLADEAWSEKRGLAPVVRLISYGIAAVEPGMFGLGPIPAVKQASACGRPVL